MTKLPKGEFIVYFDGSDVFQFLYFLEETKPLLVFAGKIITKRGVMCITS